MNFMIKLVPKLLPKVVSDYVQPRLGHTIKEALKTTSLPQGATTISSDLTELELKEKLYDMMFESGSSITHEAHWGIYNCLGESIKIEKLEARYGKTPSTKKKRSHNDQDPPKNLDDGDEPRQEEEHEHEVQSELVDAEEEPEEHELLNGSIVLFGKCMKKFLNKDKITKEDLEGPAFELLKKRFKNSFDLEYNLEQCHLALTNKINWANLEGNSMEMKKRVVKKRVEDIQLGVKSYQTKHNLTKPQFMKGCLHQKVSYTTLIHPRGIMYKGTHDRKRLMRADEIQKISDGTLKIYSKLEIEKTLKERRRFRRLEFFVGERRNKTDYRFLVKLDIMYEVSHIPSLEYVACLLQRRALTWLNTQIKTRGREAANEMTWETFKKLLVEEYCRKDKLQRLEAEFWNHRTKGTKIEKYAINFHELAGMVPHMASIEEKRVDQYLLGLSPPIRRNVTSLKPTTMRAVVSLAHRLTLDIVRHGGAPKGGDSGKKRKDDQRKNKGNRETLVVQGDKLGKDLKIVPVMKMRRYLEKYCVTFLAHVVDTGVKIEFQIDLVPGAAPVAKAPYRLAPSEVTNAIWVIMDRLTKSAHFLLIREEYPMEKLAQLYINDIMARHGTPILIISDRDNYGQSERTIQIIEDMMRAYVMNYGDSCDSHIPLVVALLVRGGRSIVNETRHHPRNGRQDNNEKGKVENRKESAEDLCRCKLNPRYVGPFRILKKVGPVAYRLELPKELSGIHEVFHVSSLKKCLVDKTLVVPLEETQIADKLQFIEELLEIMDQEVKRLKHCRIPIMKVIKSIGTEVYEKWPKLVPILIYLVEVLKSDEGYYISPRSNL
ncbi:putative reverse transcriptase domain-containing protein [Tanacetum coccineum]